MTFFDIVDGSLAFENNLKSIKRVGGCGAMAVPRAPNLPRKAGEPAPDLIGGRLLRGAKQSGGVILGAAVDPHPNPPLFKGRGRTENAHARSITRWLGSTSQDLCAEVPPASRADARLVRLRGQPAGPRHRLARRKYSRMRSEQAQGRRDLSSSFLNRPAPGEHALRSRPGSRARLCPSRRPWRRSLRTSRRRPVARTHGRGR
jgi:hypothetical protein